MGKWGRKRGVWPTLRAMRAWLFKTYWSETYWTADFSSIQNYTGHSTLFQFVLPVKFIFKNAINFTEVRWDNHVFNPWWNKTLWSLLYQGYIATTRKKITFYHSVRRSFRYSTDQPQKDERLSWICSQPVVLNRGLHWSMKRGPSKNWEPSKN